MSTPEIAGLQSRLQSTAAELINVDLIDAKGDLLAGTANNTIARVAVGTNGHILVADSAETAGVKWAAAPEGFTTGKAIAMALIF